MTKTLIATAAAATVALSLGAATAYADRVDSRQARQADRIEQGIRNGSLTRQEAAKLKAEQEYIAALERQAERDGRLSREERARLEAAQDRASKHIRSEKHDADNRYTHSQPWKDYRYTHSQRWRKWKRWSWSGDGNLNNSHRQRHWW